MSDDYKDLVDENARLKSQVAALDQSRLILAEALAAARHEAAELQGQLAKALKPRRRQLDPEAASAFDRPYDGR